MAKIMLVEDDTNLREIYGARLSAEGYQIVSASDGEEALALAVKERPDLIIADVMMPKISGFDMLDILRTTPETQHTKIIMMTALSQPEDRQRGEQLGADKYLVKSQVTLEDVVASVHEILGDDGAPVKAGGVVAPQMTNTPTAPAPITNSVPQDPPTPTGAPSSPSVPADNQTSSALPPPATGMPLPSDNTNPQPVDPNSASTDDSAKE